MLGYCRQAVSRRKIRRCRVVRRGNPTAPASVPASSRASVPSRFQSGSGSGRPPPHGINVCGKPAPSARSAHGSGRTTTDSDAKTRVILLNFSQGCDILRAAHSFAPAKAGRKHNLQKESTMSVGANAFFPSEYSWAPCHRRPSVLASSVRLVIRAGNQVPHVKRIFLIVVR